MKLLVFGRHSPVRRILSFCSSTQLISAEVGKVTENPGGEQS